MSYPLKPEAGREAGRLERLSFDEKRDLVILIVRGGRTYRVTADLHGMVDITGRIDSRALAGPPGAASPLPGDVTKSNTLRVARYET